MKPTLDDARAHDAVDPLAHFGADFVRHSDPVAYLDGNSLGRPPKATIARLHHVLDHEWGERLIRSWEERWVSLPVEVGDRIGAAVIGAARGQTIVADSTTVNLYKVLHAACSLRTDRTEIVIDDANFPTDRYLVESVAASRNLTVRWISPELIEGVTRELLSTALSEQTAVVLLSHIDYRSGAIADLGGVTADIHDCGALAVWDLCHSVGVVPIALDADDVDFAVGCTYKYLNAGPGAPAFMYVARRHLAGVEQPITGWWSSADMFAMAADYEPAPTISKMLSGTANVLGMVAVDEGVKMVADAGLEAIRQKSIGLTRFAIAMADSHGLEVVSPRDDSVRGSHVSVRIDNAAAVNAKLIARQIVPDFRNPDMIRLGFSPLTTSYEEVWTAMDALRDIVETDEGAGTEGSSIP